MPRVIPLVAAAAGGLRSSHARGLSSEIDLPMALHIRLLWLAYGWRAVRS